jgi:NAD(P)-dependent dehydrogenase (short-subunit alcohol dehydrogenase family)
LAETGAGRRPDVPEPAAAYRRVHEYFRTSRSHHRRVPRAGLRARRRAQRSRVPACHRRQGRAGAGHGDIADPAHRAALAAAATDLGGASLLVNNAGTLGASPLPALADYPAADLLAALDVNVVAPIALTQLLLPDLRRAGGAVLCVTSDAAVEPYAGWGGYGAAKAALEQACNVLAAEESAVRVWWVDPGDLRTRMHQEAFPGEDISDRPLPVTVTPAFLHLLAERMPSGRYRAADLRPAGVAA